ncbi:WD40 repeat domain-containing protein [Rhodopila globiformis]|uniref:WD40 repeat domain-containing protein n=1 Tax=Rhodopila globiformis TaxID=1071 RepID=UPI001305032A|nr:hypothetical protein [Rhodopila globiformis]
MLAVAWDRRTRVAGFGLADGTVALVHPAWDGGPTVKRRDAGNVELVPASVPVPPDARAKAHSGTCDVIAPDPDGGFLTGGSDGRVARVRLDGEMRALDYFDGPVTMLAAGPGQWRACAIRDTVHRIGGAVPRISLPGAVSALALHPAGAELAIGHPAGVTLWAGGASPRLRPMPGQVDGLCWGGDQDTLVATTLDGLMRAWHEGQVCDMRLENGAACQAPLAGDGFVAGREGRLARWLPPESAMQPFGLRNQSSVTHLAGHPRRPLMVAGYANGTVALFQPNTEGLLLILAPAEGAVSALAFSPDGDCLAVGTDDGDIGALSLPGALFREQARRE